MKKLLTRTAAAVGMALLAAGAASAQSYPGNISGTWNIRANDTEIFTFTISSQSSDTPCALITGVIGAPNDTLVGYYCPATGGVSFLRNSASNGATYQVYTGQVSWLGDQTNLTGNFTNYGGTNTGAYGFTASISGL